jgi:hypothetical protein
VNGDLSISTAAAGVLLASGLRRIDDSAQRAARADVLRRLDLVRSNTRRRGSNAMGYTSIALAAMIMLYEHRRRRRAALAPRSPARDDLAANEG